VIPRLHVPALAPAGTLVELGEREAHHARVVLRLKPGDDVELFDDAGNVARGLISDIGQVAVTVAIGDCGFAPDELDLTIASAVPKGDRADWMIEKLSELGVSCFIPLRTARSVVHPTGTAKYERWRRIATEAAKQSRRRGVLQIDALTTIEEVTQRHTSAIALSPASDQSLQSAIRNSQSSITLLVGPEGGWSKDELAMFDARRLTGARLTRTILRVETAAVAAAAIVASIVASHDHPARR
jgi:16S rRNA (uracil1498-N3)-methyltransferase